METHHTFCYRLSCNLSTELSGIPTCSVSVDLLRIVGEPTEKLFLWGQSGCILNIEKQKHVLTFGGFGGEGRHARRNYTLMLEPQSGLLKEIDVLSSPSSRLGHTASVIGYNVFVIGGRGDPTQILNDVWVLHAVEKRWTLLECSGSIFRQRHRHAAAAVGSNIYVFGGLNGDLIYSCMNVLNIDTSQWSEVSIQGEWPSARHSHSLVANGPILFMFGGYDGEKALGDLYSFDIRTCLWKKEKTSGIAPFPRFSHSMFIYKDFLGIIGGCPIKQQNQELALLDLHHLVWILVSVDSVGRDIWVRSSACIIDDDLLIVGGGTSCYAFGTKFNQPVKINLHVLDSLYGVATDRETKPVIKGQKAVGNSLPHCSNHLQDISHSSNSHLELGTPNGDKCTDAKYVSFQVEKRNAKLAKDLLKKFGWLDLSMKVQRSLDGSHIYLPITNSFYHFYQKECVNFTNTSENCQVGSSAVEGISLNEVSIPMALTFLLSCGSYIEIDDVTCTRKVCKAPHRVLKELVCSLLKEKGMPRTLLEQLPSRWERLGDIVVLPVNSFKDPIWDSIGEELWPIVAKSLSAQRLARQGRILPTGTRDSSLEILVGDDGWVTHQENGILYSFDTTKCMFSSGNLSEKLRMAHLDCRDEIVVDLFAGIGYFVLPFLVKAKAKLVYACEWNPHAIKALQHNVHANLVADRCIILEGDNRVTAPKGVADRVCLGLIPSSEGSWIAAVKALRAEGGVLHVHGNVNDSEENSWLEYVVSSIGNIALSEGLAWDVSLQHLERVKWYGPHIRHLVADVRCKQL